MAKIKNYQRRILKQIKKHQMLMTSTCPMNMFPATFKDSAGVVPRPNANNFPMVLIIACIIPKWYKIAMTEQKYTTTGIT